MNKTTIVSTAKLRTVSVLAAALVFGCSAKDKPTDTPVYHVGTMTNSSSVNSWELYTDPTHTQPGVYHGAPASLRSVPSLRGFEPYDPLAVKVFAALSADNTLNTRYMSAGAKGGVVVLVGSVASKAQQDQALSDAKKVEGVKQVHSQLAIQQASN